MTLSYEAGILLILRRELGADILKWPVPPHSRPSLFFGGDNRAIENAINRALVLAGQPEISAGFRRRFHAVPATHPQQQIHPEWWWSRWSGAMDLEFKNYRDLEAEITAVARAENATKIPEAKRKRAADVLRAVRPYLADLHDDLLQSNSLPIGNEASLKPDVVEERARIAALLKDVDAIIENPSDDALAGGAAAAIRGLLNEAGVPQWAFIDDHVMAALWQRDRARETIVDIHEAISGRAPRQAIARIKEIIATLAATPNV